MSDLQIAANRENARHSTGPRTEAGKQRSSLNATRHGLTGQVVVLPQEDFQRYQSFCQEFFEEWSPQGPTEKHLVQTLADSQWRLHRAHARERAVYAMGHERLGDQVDTAHPEVHALFTSAIVEEEHSQSLDRLSRYASRIQRDYQKILVLLQSLQAARKQREQADLAEAALLYNFFEMKQEKWSPADFGFVLTLGKIAAHSRRQDRLAQARLAGRFRFDLQKFRAARRRGLVTARHCAAIWA